MNNSEKNKKLTFSSNIIKRGLTIARSELADIKPNPRILRLLLCNYWRNSILGHDQRTIFSIVGMNSEAIIEWDAFSGYQKSFVFPPKEYKKFVRILDGGKFAVCSNSYYSDYGNKVGILDLNNNLITKEYNLNEIPEYIIFVDGEISSIIGKKFYDDLYYEGLIYTKDGHYCIVTCDFGTTKCPDIEIM
mgnify:CR=1 FL=1